MNYKQRQIQRTIRNMINSNQVNGEASNLISRNMQNGTLNAEQFMIGNLVQVMKNNAEISNENTKEIVDVIDNIYKQPIAKSEFSEMKMILEDIKNNAVTFYNKILEGKLENQFEKYNVIPAEYETLDVKKEEKEEDIKKEEEKKSTLFMNIADVLDDIKTKLYEKKEKQFDIPLKKIIGFFKPLFGTIGKIGLTVFGSTKFYEGILDSEKLIGRKLNLAKLDDMPDVIKVGFANFLSSLTGHLVKPETIYNFFSTVQNRMMDFIHTMTGIQDFGKVFKDIGGNISNSFRPTLVEYLGKDSIVVKSFDKIIDTIKDPLAFFQNIWQDIYITIASLARWFGGGMKDSYADIFKEVELEQLGVDLNKLKNIENVEQQIKDLQTKSKLFDSSKMEQILTKIYGEETEGGQLFINKSLKDIIKDLTKVSRTELANYNLYDEFKKYRDAGLELYDIGNMINRLERIEEEFKYNPNIDDVGMTSYKILQSSYSQKEQEFKANLKQKEEELINLKKSLETEMDNARKLTKSPISLKQTDKTLNATNMNKQAELKSEAEKKTTTPVIVNENNTVNNNVISNGNDLTTSMGNTQTDYAVRESMR